MISNLLATMPRWLVAMVLVGILCLVACLGWHLLTVAFEWGFKITLPDGTTFDGGTNRVAGQIAH